MKRITGLIIASILGGILSLSGFIYLSNNSDASAGLPEALQPKVVRTNFATVPNYAAEATDFTVAAERTVHAVVHVTNVSVSPSNPLLEFFYGSDAGGGRPAIGTGSGVIISPDGYIITNNHVIKGAREIKITLNNSKSYNAELVGADASSDIALLKIDADDLPYLPFANSDNVKVGEWVLAVGNPFNLTSTVTAGIVSAKARNINVSNAMARQSVSSFIQTDAAVNPGNSGGALVNVRGELIGINTAITSQTGSYIGYSFAVPSNIAKKVVEDLMEYGDVKAAYLGVTIGELNQEVIDNLALTVSEGVLVADVTEEGGAKAAGIEPNDIITQIDHIKIKKFSDLKGFLGAKRPGDIVKVTVLRDGKEKQMEVRLSNQFGKTTIGKLDYSKFLLGDLTEISKSNAKKFRINYGVQFVKVRNKGFVEAGVKAGDMILKINDTKVYNVQDVEDILRANKGKIVNLQLLNQEGYAEYTRLLVNN
ncbi:MAG: serine protease [Flavobacteriales bacterium]|nr:MAG: serine protease [Flavobacteriales bacterium]